MAPQPDSQPSSDGSYHEYAAPGENIRPPSDQSLVQEILQLLEGETNSAQEVDSATLQELAKVRARHPGPVLSLEAMMDLLQVLLELPSPSDRTNGPVDPQTLLRQVAQTLLDSSQVRARIDAIWINLANVSVSP